ncbi:hypothetical protein O0L34_g16009 [Tuta absoluta]|nr:hypothetical protein O0L34_g16009 [Tuta absoluta]
MRKVSRRFFDNANATNSLIVAASNYYPHPTSRFKHRPRHVLSDNDDGITVAAAAAIASRSHSTSSSSNQHPRRPSFVPHFGNYRHVPGRFSPIRSSQNNL